MGRNLHHGGSSAQIVSGVSPIDFDLDRSSEIPIDVGAAPSGYGSMYDRLFSANPYRNLTYNKTWWQRTLSGLGFRTSADKFFEDAQIQAAEYDARIFELMQQNEFNEPSAQSDRMRAAGINPDLLGTGDVAEAASSAPDPNGMSSEVGNDFQSVRDFGMMIASCFSGAMAMVKEGIDLYGMASDIEGKNIGNALSLDELANTVIRRNIPAEGFSDDADYLSWIEGLHQSPDLKWSQSLARSLGLSRKSRKGFETAYESAIGNLPNTLEMFKQQRELAGEKLGYARQTDSKYYNQSFEVMQELNQPLTDLDDDLTEIQKKNAVAQANVQSSEIENQGIQADIHGQYLDVLQSQDAGAKQGLNEVEGLNLQHMQNEIDDAVKKARKSILATLSRLAESGNEFAAFMYHNMMLNDFLKFDFRTKLEAGLNRNPSPWTSWLPTFGADVEFGVSY